MIVRSPGGLPPETKRRSGVHAVVGATDLFGDELAPSSRDDGAEYPDLGTACPIATADGQWLTSRAQVCTMVEALGEEAVLRLARDEGVELTAEVVSSPRGMEDKLVGHLIDRIDGVIPGTAGQACMGPAPPPPAGGALQPANDTGKLGRGVALPPSPPQGWARHTPPSPVSAPPSKVRDGSGVPHSNVDHAERHLVDEVALTGCTQQWLDGECIARPSWKEMSFAQQDTALNLGFDEPGWGAAVTRCSDPGEERNEEQTEGKSKTKKPSRTRKLVRKVRTQDASSSGTCDGDAPEVPFAIASLHHTAASGTSSALGLNGLSGLSGLPGLSGLRGQPRAGDALARGTESTMGATGFAGGGVRVAIRR